MCLSLQQKKCCPKTAVVFDQAPWGVQEEFEVSCQDLAEARCGQAHHLVILCCSGEFDNHHKIHTDAGNLFGGMAKGLGAWEIRVALNHPWESEWGWSILFTSFHVFSCISVLHVVHAIMASNLWLSNGRSSLPPPPPVFWPLKMDVRSDWESWGN